MNNIIMKKTILITWSSKWLWNFLVDNLKNAYKVIWVSRNSRKEKDILEFNIDLTNFELFNNLVDFLEERKIQLDWIILNAGVWYYWKFDEIDEEKYIEMINLNLISQILILKKINKFLNKASKIIFIWSISSKKFYKYWAVYQASKFWLRGFAWSLKNEWKDKNIFFLNPVIIDTEFHKNSKIDLNFKEDDYTKKENILKIIEDILLWEEKRFEIDF